MGLTMRIGGGYHTFEVIVPNSHREWEKTMLQNMMKSKESLEWCCEAIMNNEKIPTVANAYQYKRNNMYSNTVISRRKPNYDDPYADEPRSPGRGSGSPRRQTAKGNRYSPVRENRFVSGEDSPYKKSGSRRNSATLFDAELRNNSSPVKRYRLPNRNNTHTETTWKFDEEEEKRLIALYESNRERILKMLKDNQDSKARVLADIERRIQELLKNYTTMTQ